MADDPTQGYEGYETPVRPAGWMEPTVKRYLSILRRHVWPAISLFVIVVTFGMLRAYRAPPIYEAVAKILVERQGPRVTKFEDVMQPSVEWWGQDYYKTQEELLESRAVLELALEQPGMREMFPGGVVAVQKPTFRSSVRQTISAVLGMPPSLPPEPWEQLRGYVQARQVNDTHFIAVSIASGNPERAAKIANAVARAFVRYHMLRRLEVSNDVFLFLEEQKEKEERALQAAEQKLQQFREETQISSLNAADKDHPVLRRLSLLNEQLTQTQLRRIETEAQYRVVKQAMASPAGEGVDSADTKLFSIPAVSSDQTISEIRTALVGAEQERASLADVYGSEHPRMQAVQSKIGLLRMKLRESLQSVSDSLSTRLIMLADEEAKLNEENDQQNVLALDLAKSSLTFERLANEVERHQKLYQVLVERMSEVQLSADYTKTNVEVVEQAGVPKAPVRPNKPRMILFSAFLALALGIGLAFFLEHIDDTVRTPEDLEMRVGIPVLGFVPEIQVKKNVESRASYRALVCALEPTSSAIEAYRNIRTNLFFSGGSGDGRVLLVTSGGPGDGKTTTACNLALVIAQSGKRVLLIDADFRRPRVHKVFGLDVAPGLSAVLQGQCDFAQAVQKTVHDLEIIENLDILTAGSTPPNPTELLEDEVMRNLLADVRDKYDKVIIDTPPVLFVSDASILSTLGDGVILVVKSDRRTRAHAARARAQLEKVKARIIGGILNNVQVSRLGQYYSDYYYHGYARYRSDYYSSYYGAEEEGKKKASQRSVGV